MPLVVIVKVPVMMPAIVMVIRIAVVGIGGDDDSLLMGVLGGNHAGDSAKHGAEYAERNGDDGYTNIHRVVGTAARRGNLCLPCAS